MKRVLFVCVHNAGRSVMAEAMFNRLAAGRAEAVSAGTEPQGAPHPEVVEAMREVGFDPKGQSPARVREIRDEIARRIDELVRSLDGLQG